MHRPRWACLVAATEVVEANRTHSGVLEQERETVTLTVTPEREGLRVYTRGGEWIRCSNASCRGPCCRPANAVSQIALHFIYTYRGSNLGYAETHPPSGSQLDTKRLTRVLDTGPRPPHRPPARRTPHAPEYTRAPALRGIRRLWQTAAVSLWRALSPECLPPSAHPGARPRVSEAHATFASSSPHLPRVIWIEIRGMRGAASPRRQRLCRRR